jgi:hypothetical protein
MPWVLYQMQVCLFLSYEVQIQILQNRVQRYHISLIQLSFGFLSLIEILISVSLIPFIEKIRNDLYR